MSDSPSLGEARKATEKTGSITVWVLWQCLCGAQTLLCSNCSVLFAQSDAVCERTELEAIRFAREMQAEYWSVSAKTGTLLQRM